MSHNEKRPAAKQAVQVGSEQANILDRVLIAGAVVLVAAFCMYWFAFGGLGWSNRQDVWGQAGDFIGGICNPLLSLLALVALLKTVQLQAAQLDAAREELDSTRKSQGDQLAVAQAQLDLAKEEAREARDVGLEQLKASRALTDAQTRTAEAQGRLAEAISSQTASAQKQARISAFAAELSAVHAALSTLPTSDRTTSMTQKVQRTSLEAERTQLLGWLMAERPDMSEDD